MNITFITIATQNLEESIRFYRDVLGFTLLDCIEPSPGVHIAFLKDEAGTKIELIQRVNAPVLSNSDAAVSLTFEVDNLEETHNRMKELGVEIPNPPQELPSGIKLMLLKDPNNVTLGFIEMEGN